MKRAILIIAVGAILIGATWNEWINVWIKGAMIVTGGLQVGEGEGEGETGVLYLVPGTAPAQRNGNVWEESDGLHESSGGANTGPLITAAGVLWATPGAIGTTTPAHGTFDYLAVTSAGEGEGEFLTDLVVAAIGGYGSLVTRGQSDTRRGTLAIYGDSGRAGGIGLFGAGGNWTLLPATDGSLAATVDSGTAAFRLGTQDSQPGALVVSANMDTVGSAVSLEGPDVDWELKNFSGDLTIGYGLAHSTPNTAVVTCNTAAVTVNIAAVFGSSMTEKVADITAENTSLVGSYAVGLDVTAGNVFTRATEWDAAYTLVRMTGYAGQTVSIVAQAEAVNGIPMNNSDNLRMKDYYYTLPIGQAISFVNVADLWYQVSGGASSAPGEGEGEGESQPGPTIDSLDPVTGWIGDPVWITGSGFVKFGLTKVYFGPYYSDYVYVSSSTLIGCTVPEWAFNLVDVEVINPDQQYYTKQDAFTYVAP